MGRFRIVEDDVDEAKEGADCEVKSWQFAGFDEREDLTIVRFANDEQQEKPQRQPSTRDATMLSNTATTNETMPYIRGIYSDENMFGDGSGNRGCCNLFRWSMAVVFFGILCHAYLPPAPPPPETTSALLTFKISSFKVARSEMEIDEDLYITWRSYLQSHSQQILESTKALVIDTPWHILSWLGIALYKDLQSTYDATITTTTTDCSWKIPRSMELVQQGLSAHVIGQELAVERLAEALVGWDQTKPLTILAIGSKSTGKSTLAQAIVSLYANCPGIDLNIPKNDPRTTQQLLYRIQQHVHQFPQASMVLYHHHHHPIDNNLVDPFPSNIENAEKVIFYRTSTTLGSSTMAQHLRARNWGSPSMMADLRAELDLYTPHYHDHHPHKTLILPFAPMTPKVLAAILQQYELDDLESSLLKMVEYMDWTTKEGELIMRVAIEGAQGLPWNRIHAQKASRKEMSSQEAL